MGSSYIYFQDFKILGTLGRTLTLGLLKELKSRFVRTSSRQTVLLTFSDVVAAEAAASADQNI